MTSNYGELDLATAQMNAGDMNTPPSGEYFKPSYVKKRDTMMQELKHIADDMKKVDERMKVMDGNMRHLNDEIQTLKKAREEKHVLEQENRSLKEENRVLSEKVNELMEFKTKVTNWINGVAPAVEKINDKVGAGLIDNGKAILRNQLIIVDRVFNEYIYVDSKSPETNRVTAPDLRDTIIEVGMQNGVKIRVNDVVNLLRVHFGEKFTGWDRSGSTYYIKGYSWKQTPQQ